MATFGEMKLHPWTGQMEGMTMITRREFRTQCEAPGCTAQATEELVDETGTRLGQYCPLHIMQAQAKQVTGNAAAGVVEWFPMKGEKGF